MKKIYVYLAMALVMLLNWVATGVYASADSTPAAASCHVKDIEAKAQCLTVSVPEDWSNPDGKHISLFVAIVPPSGGQAIKEPLYVLAGGPGQPASTLGRAVEFSLEQARRGREVILLDQRGTGKSAPFGCRLGLNDHDISGEKFARECLASTTNSPRFYNSAAFIRDLDEVRKTLGHGRINLYGGSYGTRAALLYLREYPQHVRSLVLDGVAAPETAFFEQFHRSANRALNNLYTDCAGDADCNRAFPQLEQTTQDVLNELENVPVQLTRPLSIEVTPDIFLNALRNALYSPLATAQLPMVISQAADGNFGPWMAIAGGMNGVYQDMSIGLMMSVLCGEEIDSTSAARMKALATDGAYENVSVDFWFDACKVWPHSVADADYREPLVSDVPVLLLSGEQDPVTPPSFGHIAESRLSNAVHIVAPYGGHTIGAYACVPRLVGNFLDTLDPGSIDSSCLDDFTREPFVVDSFGPQP